MKNRSNNQSKTPTAKGENEYGICRLKKTKGLRKKKQSNSFLRGNGRNRGLQKGRNEKKKS